MCVLKNRQIVATSISNIKHKMVGDVFHNFVSGSNGFCKNGLLEFYRLICKASASKTEYFVLGDMKTEELRENLSE